MADLQSIFREIANGAISLDQAASRLGQIVQAPGESADKIVSRLQAAHGAGRITDETYARLKRAALEAGGGSDDTHEATVLATEHRPAAPSAGDATPADDSAGDDPTIALNPDDEDRTVVKPSTEGHGGSAKPPGDPDAGDEDRTIALDPDDEERTVVHDADDEDRTIARDPGGGETGDDDDDRTIAVDEFDPDAHTELATDPGSGTSPPGGVHHDLGGNTQPTGPSTDPSSGAYTTGGTSKGTAERSWTPVGADGETIEELQGLGPGSVIKDRFVLDKVLGTGGMGKVYAARDLLKVEARDKNPHVALKLLTEDFKQHPEAFIALQREASRQQKLAHPNIATVYDFDRIGRSGTQVFITMELMEGMPLNDFIRKKVRPKGGLSFEEALPMVQGLGAALSYAHQRNIVHSDFKPGNAFLCNDGTVKTLDFGIARAVKAPGQQEGGDGEKTLFDAAELGALTPAYASLEMLQGEDPHPRDDLYALACVAYELLTGYHPFNKKPATVARDSGMVPAPIKGLKRRQWRGLMRGLAFEREKRSKDVETFLEEFEGRLNWHKNPWVIGGAMAATLAVAAINPALDYMEERRIEALISQVETGQSEAIQSVLLELPELGASARATVTDETRSILQQYFEDRLDEAVSLEEGRYDFDRADAIHAQAQSIYPDSATVIAMGERIDALRDERLSELNQEMIAALENNRLLERDADDGEPTVTNILDQIAAIDPEHPLLEDPRIPDAYASAAQADINIVWLDQAREYLETGLSMFPNDIDLINTRDRLELAEERENRREQVEELHARLENEIDDMQTVAAFAELDEAIIELSRIAPDDSTLAHIGERLAPIVSDEIDGILENGDIDAASRFAAEHGQLLRAAGLHNELLRIDLALLEGEELERAREEIATDTRDAIQAHLDQADIHDRTWESGLRDHLRLLTALQANGGNDPQEQQEQIAELYMDTARLLEEEQRHSLALATLDRAAAFDLQQPAIAALREEIDEARIAFLSEREEATRQARLEGMKQTLQLQAQALQIDDARETFAELQAELPDDDPFLEITGPDALATAFAELAEQRAEEDRFREAVALTEQGLEYAPNHQVLTGDRQNYIVEANARELTQIFSDERSFDTVETTRMVDEIRTYAPTRYGQLEQEYVTILAERIERIAGNDREAAERLANRATNVFPGSAVLAQIRDDVTPEAWPEGTAARAALGAGRLSEARVILQSARRQHPDHPEVQNFQEDFEARVAEAEQAFARHEQALEDDDLQVAREQLSEARSLWADNSDYRSAAANLSERIAIERWRQSRVLQRGQDIDALRAEQEMTGVDVATEDWDPIESNRPCTYELAGHGRRARAICYDLIHDRVRGPLMVVAPGNEEHHTFAISKYEISNEDWNKYCFLSGDCPVDDDADGGLPKTGLTLADIREFTGWLSERTGKTYRLPRSSEWEYAAYANGQQPPRDFNCRVRLGGQTLKGTDFVNVTSGQMNGWGMKNYVGNSQELVTNGTDLYVRGGAYTEAHSRCDISIQRPHDGQSDPLTGFRIVLEDITEAD